jgi:hypothetical protein
MGQKPRRRVTATGPARCHDCKARVVFVKMTYTGKRLPVDPIPVADGNVCARRIGNNLHGWVVSAEHPAGPGITRYTAHHATCADRPPPKGKPEPPPALFDL